MARIAVIGDVMLDVYFICDVAGFSPEDDLAPKLIVREKTFKPGGAANVACCLSRWGSDVGIFGVTGNDFPCETLSSLLRKERLEGVYLSSLIGRPTTCKTRIVTRKSRQVVRLDEEWTKDIQEQLARKLVQEVAAFAPDVVVVSDYNKGVVTRELMSFLHAARNRELIVVDPKTPNFDFYGPVSIITPNEKEMQAFLEREPDASCAAEHIVATYAEKGARVYTGGMRPEFRVPVRAREIGDPAGCGDAFLAALVHALCHEMSLPQACLAASAAGALAFDMLGVACPSWDQIKQELSLPEYKEVKDGES